MKREFFLSAALILVMPIAAADDRILIQRADVTVTEEEVSTYLVDRVPAGRRLDFLNNPKSVRDMAESLYIMKALAKESEKTDLVDYDQIEKQLKIQRDRLAMTQYLEKTIDAQLAKVDWDAAAADEYKAHKDDYKTSESVRASHILVKTDTRTDEEALALIAKIQSEISEGKGFNALAVLYSEDPSAATNSGSLGRFTRGRMVKEFDDVVFGMRTPGEISQPVKTQFGYHLIQLNEYMPGGVKSFEEVKSEIINKLKIDMVKKLQETKVIAVRSAKDIQWDEQLVEELRNKFRKETLELLK